MSRRRVEGAALAAVLAVGGAVPVAQWAASAATKAAPCPTWTDPDGDASTGQLPNVTGQTGDKNLDIVSSTFSTTTDTITAVVKMSAVNASASDAGDYLFVDFTAGGKDLELYSQRDLDGDSAGLYNYTDKKSASGKAVATYDDKASTVTITAKLSDLADLAGVSLAKAAVTDLFTQTGDSFLGEPGVTYDQSTTTLTPVLGVACGSAKPTPTAKPSATPSPKPTTGGSSGGSTAPQVSADPSKDFPKAGCTTFVDPKGDAHPLNQPSAPNDPDLDITSVTLRTTTTDLVAYAAVDKLAAGTATFDGQRYTLDFTFNGHVFSAAGSSSARGSSALRDVAASSGQAGHVVQLGVDVPALTSPSADKGFKASGLKVTYDLANSRVVFALPIADIEKYGMAKFTGKLTAVDVKSATDTNVVSSQADSSAKDNATTSTDTWTVNDNVCFPKKK